jgi:hypothetical protein
VCQLGSLEVEELDAAVRSSGSDEVAVGVKRDSGEF